MNLNRTIGLCAALLALLALLALVSVSACSRADAEPARARRVQVIDGLSFPESVRYDAAQDVFFVSCIQGFGSVKDGRGYIARVRGGDLHTIEIFVQSGVNGAVLDAPKGMTLQGDTLWVTDIDVVRGFHRRTGAPVGTIDLRQHEIAMLNDIATGPDGALYVTDSGILMTPVGVAYVGGSKVLRIDQRQSTLVAAGKELAHPNGITWDAHGERWIVVTFHPHASEVYEFRPGSGDPKRPLLRGTGRFDGVEALPDGRLLVTSWMDSALDVVQDERAERVVSGIWQPADLGIDTRRGRVAIPLVLQGRVEVWTLP